MSTLEQMIQQKAYDLGYFKCGIVPIEKLDGYSERLNERMEKEPSSKPFYSNLLFLTKVLERFPWAKAAVIVASYYGKYKIPENAKGRIGKTYLFDIRTDSGSKEYQSSIALEQYLTEMGLKTVSNHNFGDIPLRWTAMKAGLGIIRKNNFFYTQAGSYVQLEAWLIDRKMELIETNSLPPCPEGCRKCIDSCPSHSLTSPYTMNPINCISLLTTLNLRDLSQGSIRNTLGSWIYGCDACQDACPMNKGKIDEKFDFPGVEELSDHLSPEKIMEMDEVYYKQNVQPKFFYLKPEELWKWKINALCYMRNNYEDSYKTYILSACEDGNEKIRELAGQIKRELFK